MQRLIERCAGLDVHRDTVATCVRAPAEDGGRRQEVRTFATTTSQLRRLALWLADNGVTTVGVHRRVLEAGVIPVGRRVRLLAAQRSPPAQRAGAQDRRGRRGLDLRAGRTRPGAPQLRAAPPDPPAARPHPLPQSGD